MASNFYFARIVSSRIRQLQKNLSILSSTRGVELITTSILFLKTRENDDPSTSGVQVVNATMNEIAETYLEGKGNDCSFTHVYVT